MSVTFEVVEHEGERITVASVVDDQAPAKNVDLVLGDWRPGEILPAAMEVTVRKQTGLVSRDVRIPLGRYLEVIAGGVAHLMELFGDPSYARGRRRPTTLTDDFLSAVVEAYKAAPEGGRIKGVQAAHPASDSQVYRWLRAARERGLMGEGA